MPVLTRGLIAGLTLTIFVVAIPALANLNQSDVFKANIYSHPHNSSSQSILHEPHVSPELEVERDIDVVLSAKFPPQQPAQTLRSPDTSDLDVRDFNIEDFIGADGQVDLEKLRAYENGDTLQDQFKWTQDSDLAGPEAGAQIFVFDEDGQTLKPAPQTYTYDSHETYGGAKAPHERSTSSLNSNVTRAIDRLMNALKSETHSQEGKRDIDVKIVNPERSVRVIKLDRHEETSTADDAGRTISLSGETKIVIGEDGEITITNNGDAIVPLSMMGHESGHSSAMVMDAGKPAKISVHKTVEHNNGKRHIHVEVDMEIDD